MYGGTTAEILLVEDDPARVRLAHAALDEHVPGLRLSVQHDGEQALAFLHGAGAHVAAPRPDLILLDANLATKDGLVVLEELKGDEALKSIPVVMLVSAEQAGKVRRGYDLHANCYVVTPREPEQFAMTMRSIAEFWLTTVTLPPRS